MPKIDASQWSGKVIEEERATLAEQGAEPVLTLAWLSQAEVAQRQRDAAEDVRIAQLKAQGLKGANRVRHQR
jgi:hypothetical protein